MSDLDDAAIERIRRQVEPNCALCDYGVPAAECTCLETPPKATILAVLDRLAEAEKDRDVWKARAEADAEECAALRAQAATIRALGEPPKCVTCSDSGEEAPNVPCPDCYEVETDAD